MLNAVAMTGRLTADPELRHTNNNIPVTSFSIACKRDVSKKEEAITDFIDVVAWRATAEFVCKYFKKGSLITVTGRLQSRSWKDKCEQSRVSIELVADKAYFGDSKSKDGDGDGQSSDIDPFGTDASAPPPNFDPFAKR